VGEGQGIIQAAKARPAHLIRNTALVAIGKAHPIGAPIGTGILHPCSLAAPRNDWLQAQAFIPIRPPNRAPASGSQALQRRIASTQGRGTLGQPGQSQKNHPLASSLRVSWPKDGELSGLRPVHRAREPGKSRLRWPRVPLIRGEWHDQGNQQMPLAMTPAPQNNELSNWAKAQ